MRRRGSEKFGSGTSSITSCPRRSSTSGKRSLTCSANSSQGPSTSSSHVPSCPESRVRLAFTCGVVDDSSDPGCHHALDGFEGLFQ